MRYRRIYDQINKKKRLEYSKKWYHSQDKKEYRKKKREWENNAKKNNKEYLVKKRLRLRVWQAFNRYVETGKTMKSKEYGINYLEIVKKLVKEIPEDFNEREYHIDHIEPLCSFDLTDSEQIKIAFSPENHQWIELKKHQAKSKNDLKKSLKLQRKN